MRFFKHLTILIICAAFAVSAHADNGKDYEAATNCVGMYEFMALMTPADHPNMREIKNRSFAWADYARSIRPKDRSSSLHADVLFTRDYLFNVVRPEGKTALLKHLEPLQKNCAKPPVLTVAKPAQPNPFALNNPSAQMVFDKAVQCAGYFQLSVAFGDAGAVRSRKAFSDLAKLSDPNIQPQALEAKIQTHKKHHVDMMVNDNARSVTVANMCKSALRKM